MLFLREFNYSMLLWLDRCSARLYSLQLSLFCINNKNISNQRVVLSILQHPT